MAAGAVPMLCCSVGVPLVEKDPAHPCPQVLSLLASLETLDLEDNDLNARLPDWQFPAGLGHLSRLQCLNLAQCAPLPCPDASQGVTLPSCTRPCRQPRNAKSESAEAGPHCFQRQVSAHLSPRALSGSPLASRSLLRQLHRLYFSFLPVPSSQHHWHQRL